jgi:hypothetical protein
MTTDQFNASLHQDAPPSGISKQLIALWHDAKGDWQQAHDLVDGAPDQVSARIHAYLHRKEGDIWNADYWYSKSGEKRPQVGIDAEWDMLVERLCAALGN